MRFLAKMYVKTKELGPVWEGGGCIWHSYHEWANFMFKISYIV